MIKHIRENAYAIITAGGIGQRMQSDIPKQFLLLNNMPVLMHTIKAFVPYAEHIMVTLPHEHIAYWQQLVRQYQFEVPHMVINGGNTRYESVKHAVSSLPMEGLVAVHDGVRPCVSGALIQLCMQHAAEYGSAVACVPLTNSLRQKTANGSKSVSRSDFMMVQTPQVFTCKVLKQAYAQAYNSCFTDDATVVECSGMAVECVQGEDENIKITRPIDLYLAREILNHRL